MTAHARCDSLVSSLSRIVKSEALSPRGTRARRRSREGGAFGDGDHACPHSLRCRSSLLRWYARRMRALPLVLVLAACDLDAPTTTCEPEPCSSCELGYYGPAPVPPGTTLVRITSSADDARAVAWFDGTPLDVAALPALVDIPAGTRELSVTTTRGDVVVAFDCL